MTRSCYTCTIVGDFMELQDVIRVRRSELGLTLEQIAKACGVGKSIVAKWERGEVKNIRRDNLKALSDVLQVSPLVLLDRAELDDVPSSPVSFTPEETDIISKYRVLDDRGKSNVRAVLDHEYESTTQKTDLLSGLA